MWEILILGVKTAVESSSYLILIMCVFAYVCIYRYMNAKYFLLQYIHC